MVTSRKEITPAGAMAWISYIQKRQTTHGKSFKQVNISAQEAERRGELKSQLVQYKHVLAIIADCVARQEPITITGNFSDELKEACDFLNANLVKMKMLNDLSGAADAELYARMRVQEEMERLAVAEPDILKGAGAILDLHTRIELKDQEIVNVKRDYKEALRNFKDEYESLERKIEYSKERIERLDSDIEDKKKEIGGLMDENSKALEARALAEQARDKSKAAFKANHERWEELYEKLFSGYHQQKDRAEDLERTLEATVTIKDHEIKQKNEDVETMIHAQSRTAARLNAAQAGYKQVRRLAWTLAASTALFAGWLGMEKYAFNQSVPEEAILIKGDEVTVSFGNDQFRLDIDLYMILESYFKERESELKRSMTPEERFEEYKGRVQYHHLTK